MKRALSISLAAGLAVAAGAQNFNIDVENTASMGGGLPTAAFGGAGLAGMWNPLNAGSTQNNLFDILNNPTAASVTIDGFVFAAPNNQGYAGDDLLMMGDIADGPTSITMNGLVDGMYNVIVYAQAPDSTTFLTDVTIGGVTQTVGGTWGGTYSQGNTHSMHTVNVVGGTFTATISVNSGFASVNGMQVSVVPEPATFVALGLGLAGLALARRRK